MKCKRVSSIDGSKRALSKSFDFRGQYMSQNKPSTPNVLELQEDLNSSPKIKGFKVRTTTHATPGTPARRRSKSKSKTIKLNSMSRNRM
jgi:hypothetical protein